MDGATFGQRLRRVLIPLAMPGLAASGLFAFIACWDDFLVPLTFVGLSLWLLLLLWDWYFLSFN